MSVRVRLTRVGSRKNPQWRVVVADQRSPRDGRIIESLGHYDPQTQPSTIVIDRDRLQHWLERGAEPTNTVRKLMRAPDTVAGSTVVPGSAPDSSPPAPAAPEPAAAGDGEQPPGAAPSGSDAGPSGAEVPEGDAAVADEQAPAEPAASADQEPAAEPAASADGEAEPA